MLDEGASLDRVKCVASVLVHAIRLLQLSHPRVIEPIEIQVAGSAWQRDDEFRFRGTGGKWSAHKFQGITRSWLRFHGLLSKRVVVPTGFATLLTQYLDNIRFTQRLASASLFSYKERIITFLKWLGEGNYSLNDIDLMQIDSYLNHLRASGWKPRSIAGACSALRNFLRFCEGEGLCAPNIARGIFIPRIHKSQRDSRGPSWRDVRRMLRPTNDASAPQLRARAIIALCAIYGLRRSEIVNLLLQDFDWHQETFTVRRAKKGRVQQFPIQDEVGEAIIEYLKSGRPRCKCRNLFVTAQTPHRPINPCTLSDIVKKRLNALNIASQNKGTHALRHSCATQLLKNGATLREIADFLGHSGIQSVSIYAKYDSRKLRSVAAFSLAGVQ